MTTGVIIQARMGSTRLPGKVMKSIKGETILAHVVERVKQAVHIDKVIIATTTLPQDQTIADEANRLKVDCYRGSEQDVLSRYVEAAETYELDTVVRITSDCPVIDPNQIDQLVELFHCREGMIVTNGGPDDAKRTYPRGLDIEVFSIVLLKEAQQYASEDYQREHVTPYLYETYSNRVKVVQNKVDMSHHRWTLDTEEDFELISEIYGRLYRGTHNFYFNEIMQLMKEDPTLPQINAHIEQKKVKDVKE